MSGGPLTWFLVARPEKFQGGFPAAGLPEKARAAAAAFRHAGERPMVYVVSDTTICDLSLRGNDDTGFNILMESPAGPVHDVTVTRCDLFNPRTPLVTKEWLPAAAINTYGGGQRIEISWCDLRAWIVVRQFAYQNVLLNNLCRDTLQGIQMSGALDNVVDRFIGLRSGFGVWFPAYNAPKGERLYYSPSALNEVRNCIFTDTPSAVVFSGDRELAVLRQPLPLTFGNLIRGNRVIHGEVKSYGGVIANSSWLALDDARRRDAPPHASFNAFGGNSFDSMAGKPAFNFDQWTFGSPFWLNKAGERPAAAPAQAAGSVVFPSP